MRETGTFARAVGAAVWGVEAQRVDVQVSVPGAGENGVFRLVGLGDGAVKEGRERIRGAIRHCAYGWPNGMVTVNLAPASSRKEGPALDLPIALAILQAGGDLSSRRLERTLCLGELALDGKIRAVRGTIAAAEVAMEEGYTEALVPMENVGEAVAVAGMTVRGVACLQDAVGHFTGECRLPVAVPRPWRPDPPDFTALGHVRGQSSAVRAAVIAAAGGHNLLMTGPPGAGKTLVARAVRDLLPPLSQREAMEVSRVHSAAGLLDPASAATRRRRGTPPRAQVGDARRSGFPEPPSEDADDDDVDADGEEAEAPPILRLPPEPAEGGLVRKRPFRAPHHTTSLAGLMGGGPIPRPGEVSLAHLGVLFLDELAEYPRPTLEALRQPIEDGEIVLGRAAGRARFPTEVLLVAAMNPCPCGWEGSGARPCRCGTSFAARYRGRVSGPLLDRFDLHVFVKPVDPAALLARGAPPLDPGASPRAFAIARERQEDRARRLGLRRTFNGRIPSIALRDGVRAVRDAEDSLASHARRLGLSARGMHRTLRVARTMADLDDCDDVLAKHVNEAIHYRGDDK